MRIQSKEFSIIQHFGRGRDIPQMTGMSESPIAGLPSVMSDSVMMESMMLPAHG